MVQFNVLYFGRQDVFAGLIRTPLLLPCIIGSWSRRGIGNKGNSPMFLLWTIFS